MAKDYEKLKQTFQDDAEMLRLLELKQQTELLKALATKQDKIVNVEMIKGEKGDKGDTPTEEELKAIIEPLIPEPIPGKDADEEKIIKKVSKFIPTKEEILSSIKIPIPASPDVNKIVEEVLSKVPKTEINHEEILNNVVKELKEKKLLELRDIKGARLDQANGNFNMNDQRWHGAGLLNITDLIQAGSYITITGTGTSGDPYIINADLVQADWVETDDTQASFINNHYVTQINAADAANILDLIKPTNNWIYINSGQYDIRTLANASRLEYNDIVITPYADRLKEPITDYPSSSEIKISGVWTYTFQPGDSVTIGGSTNNDGTYTVLSVTDDGVDTTVTITTSSLTTSPVDGTLFWTAHVIVNVLGNGNIKLNNDAPLIQMDGYRKEFIIVRYNAFTGTYVQTGGNILPDNLISVTQAQVASLANNGQLNPGQDYLITDRGDNGLIFDAVSTTQLNRLGVRRMLVPMTYATTTIGSFNWLGVWASTLTPSVGDLVIWGGFVWSNINGSVGTAVSDIALLPSEWTIVSKSTQALAAGIYIPMNFGISYDLKDDWIEKQWDDKGNMMGISFSEQSLLYGFPYNPVDRTDWNLETSGTVFAENTAIGAFNNIAPTFYSTSSSSYVIGVIQDNNILGLLVGNTGSVYGNTNKANIYKNICPQIYLNGNDGSITENEITSLLAFNNNNGSITKNKTGNIAFNINNGSISDNECSKDITGNCNQGSINRNDNQVGRIHNNQNNGAIDANSIKGGDIFQNQNNGFINGNTSAVAGPINIFNNINNGVIGPTAFLVNVSDAIVNK